MGAELFQADRHTHMKKLIVAFGNFAKAPKRDNSQTTPRNTRQHSAYHQWYLCRRRTLSARSVREVQMRK
jgi:hypothetical protein